MFPKLIYLDATPINYVNNVCPYIKGKCDIWLDLNLLFSIPIPYNHRRVFHNQCLQYTSTFFFISLTCPDSFSVSLNVLYHFHSHQYVSEPPWVIFSVDFLREKYCGRVCQPYTTSSELVSNTKYMYVYQNSFFY